MENTHKNFVKLNKDDLPTKKVDIEALITTANKRGNEVQNLIQKAGCAAILHLAQHKDIRILRNMISSMPEGIRKDSFIKWLDLYGTITVDDIGEIHYNKDKNLQLGLALEKPWWKSKKAQVYKPFNIIEEMEKLYDKAQKRLAKADPDKGDDITPKDVNAIRKTLQELKKQESRIALVA